MDRRSANVAFPDTLALSLGERENTIAALCANLRRGSGNSLHFEGVEGGGLRSRSIWAVKASSGSPRVAIVWQRVSRLGFSLRIEVLALISIARDFEKSIRRLSRNMVAAVTFVVVVTVSLL